LAREKKHPTAKTMITAIFSLRAHSEKGLALLAMQSPVESGPRDDVFVGIWSTLLDNGDVAPRWTIGGPNGVLKQPRESISTRGTRA